MSLQLKTATSFVNREQHQRTVECVFSLKSDSNLFLMLVTFLFCFFEYKSVCVTQENRLGIVKEVTGQGRRKAVSISSTLQKVNNKEH